MNLNHLHIFYAVAEEGSISRGAARLHISQPAVSKQIAEFERTLHAPLFDRLPKGIRLTEAGSVLHECARRLFAVEAEAETALQQLRGLETGQLVIGASTSIGAYFLPVVLADFHKKHPGVSVRMEIANTERIQRDLEAGTLDIGFTEGVHSPRLETVVFHQDELVVIAAPEQAARLLGPDEPLRLARLCMEPFVLREKGSGTRAVFEEALQKRGLSVRAALTLGSTEAIKKAVAAGAGIAVVSQITVETDIQSKTLALVPVADFSLKRPLHQLQVKDRHASRATQAFIRLLRARSKEGG